MTLGSLCFSHGSIFSIHPHFFERGSREGHFSKTWSSSTIIPKEEIIFLLSFKKISPFFLIHKVSLSNLCLGLNFFFFNLGIFRIFSLFSNKPWCEIFGLLVRSLFFCLLFVLHPDIHQPFLSRNIGFDTDCFCSVFRSSMSSLSKTF